MCNWLSEEEQYKDILNDAEIARIKDPELREIRRRHWEYQRKIFLDDIRISDVRLNQLSEEDREVEQREIENYRNRKTDSQ